MVKNGYPFVLNGCIRFVLVDVLPYHLVSLAVCCIWVNAYNTSERDQRPFNKILQNKLLRLDLSNLSNQWNIICMSTCVYIYMYIHILYIMVWPFGCCYSSPLLHWSQPPGLGSWGLGRWSAEASAARTSTARWPKKKRLGIALAPTLHLSNMTYLKFTWKL